ncbi:hypothetical protein HAX54_034855, partial [Datura stramonium]|nr:hypothetical protein [Datura stramonium]
EMRPEVSASDKRLILARVRGEHLDEQMSGAGTVLKQFNSDRSITAACFACIFMTALPIIYCSTSSPPFTNKGLSLNDMVTLLGAHTVGVAHCNFFQDRLSPVPDKTMDPALAAQLLENLC